MKSNHVHFYLVLDWYMSSINASYNSWKTKLLQKVIYTKIEPLPMFNNNLPMIFNKHWPKVISYITLQTSLTHKESRFCATKGAACHRIRSLLLQVI